ncbi:MAG: S41 family peptidase [Hyphomonadaceae bacterium]
MRDLMAKAALVVTLMLAAGCGRNWQHAAVSDIEHMYEIVRSDHPGSVDPDNPAFEATLELAYRDAMERARQVNSSAGYLYALRSFTIPFQDEHLSVNFFEAMDRQLRYPGFVVSWVDGSVVVVRRDDETAPPLGSQLVSCDGSSADRLIADRIQPYIGNWSLPSKRAGDVPFLLIDTANPFLPVLTSCAFIEGGVEAQVMLNWRDLTEDDLREITSSLEPRVETPIGLRTLSDGTIWVSLGSLDLSNPDTAASIESLLRELRLHRDAIAVAPRLVVDVRGNTGGSSQPGLEVAQAIFGEARVLAAQPRIDRIDWRASPRNVAALEQYLPMLEQAFGAESPTVLRMRTVGEGLGRSLDEERPYFGEAMTYLDPTTPPDTLLPTVYLLTDTFCVSACLDFADLMLRIDGVVQVGLPTSGDTQYLEVIAQRLPSGIGQISFPVAAHRGRVRQDNQVYTPSALWDGNIADTAALEAWIASLP